jgi:hypothetical protein
MALLCCLSPALASLSPRTDPIPSKDKLPVSLPTTLPQDKPLAAEVLHAAYPAERDNEYQVTPRTAVLLDDRPCCYSDVPKNAVIVNMEVSSDDRTVLTIHFRSKR